MQPVSSIMQEYFPDHPLIKTDVFEAARTGYGQFGQPSNIGSKGDPGWLPLSCSTLIRSFWNASDCEGLRLASRKPPSDFMRATCGMRGVSVRGLTHLG